MSEPMRRQTGPTPAWLLFSGVAIGVVGASVNRCRECRRTRRGSERSDGEFGCTSGSCAWPMGLAAACCCRSRGASWAGSDCPRRPTQQRRAMDPRRCSVACGRATSAPPWLLLIHWVGGPDWNARCGLPPGLPRALALTQSDKSTDSAVTAQRLLHRETRHVRPNPALR